MVIPDASVWIEYFKGDEPYFDKLHQLIEQGSVYTVEVIFAELLQGALNPHYSPGHLLQGIITS